MTQTKPRWPVSDGHMAELIRSHPWTETPLGPSDAWPPPLRFAIDMMLASPMMATLAVGPQRIFLYNDEAARHYGPRHPGVLGQPLPLAFPDEFSKVAPFYDRVFAGESLHVPTQPLDLDESGTTEVFDAYLMPVRDAAGAVIAAVMTGFAIGERLRTEASLRESEQRLALAFKTLPVGLAIIDSAGETVAANDKMRHFLPTGVIPSRDPGRVRYWRAWDTAGALVESRDFPGARALRGQEVLPGIPMLYGDDIAGSIWTEVSSAPLRRSDGQIGGALVVVADIDRLKRAEERQAFLLELSDALRSMASADEAVAVATRLLGERLRATHVVFAEIDDPTGIAHIRPGWHADATGALPATIQLADFDGPLLDDLRAGRTICYDDFGEPPHTRADLAALAAVGIRAGLSVPLLVDDQFVATLNAYQDRPRHWTDDEVNLVTQVAERLWAAVARASAEAELRESEERQAFLLALADRLRPLGDPVAVLSMATRALGEYLDADRVGYAEDQAEDGVIAVLFDYVRDVPSLVGRYCYDDYGPELLEAFRSGQSVIRSDIANDPSLTAAEKEAHAHLQLAASVNVPLLADGVLKAVVFLHFRIPHAFDSRELTLVQGVAERVWTAVQRTRAEAALRESEERLRQFGEASQDVLWIRDTERFQWEYLTPAFETIYGLDRRIALRGDNMATWVDLILPEDRDQAVASLQRVRDGELVTFEYRVRRPLDGEVRWLRDTDFPIRTAPTLAHPEGQVVRIGGIGHDATEAKAAEEALAAAEQRQRLLLEGIPQLVWRSSHDGLWTWSSPQWQEYTGQQQQQSHGLGWLDVIHPDDREITMQSWNDARPHGRQDLEHRVKRVGDGAWRWHTTRSVPVRAARGPGEAEGRILEWLGTTTDVEDLKHLQGQQRVLVAELQHRTRNLLAVVRNLARRSIGPSPGRDEYDARLAALGRVQGFLSRSSAYLVPLADVVAAELQAAGDGTSDRVQVGGPAVELPGESVQAVALALHELATNAVKYGAIAQPSGRLSVLWRVEGHDVEGGPHLVIDWRESGVAMPRNPPTRVGFGTELITRALPYQLRAKTTLEFTADGVECQVILPANTFVAAGTGDTA